MTEKQIISAALLAFAISVVAVVYFAASYLEGCPA